MSPEMCCSTTSPLKHTATDSNSFSPSPSAPAEDCRDDSITDPRLPPAPSAAPGANSTEPRGRGESGSRAIRFLPIVFVRPWAAPPSAVGIGRPLSCHAPPPPPWVSDRVELRPVVACRYDCREESGTPCPHVEPSSPWWPPPPPPKPPMPRSCPPMPDRRRESPWRSWPWWPPRPPKCGMWPWMLMPTWWWWSAAAFRCSSRIASSVACTSPPMCTVRRVRASTATSTARLSSSIDERWMRPEPAGERRPGALEPSENRPDRCGPPGLPLWESRPDILLSNRPDDSIRRRRLPGRRGVSPAPPLPPPTPLALLSPPASAAARRPARRRRPPGASAAA